MKPVLPQAGPECARFADLLPLSAQYLLSAAQAESLQTHIRGCLHCRATLGLYSRLDDAVRRYAGADDAVPEVDPPALYYQPERRRPPAPQPRTRLSALTALVATILIAGLLAALLVTRGVGGGGGGSSSPPGPSIAILLSALDMRTPQDGWAAGQVSRIMPYVPPTTGKSSPAAITSPSIKTAAFFLHYNGSTWREFPLAEDLTITSISMISASDGWAVGSDLSGNGVILQYQSGKWAIVYRYASPAGPQYRLRSIAMTGADSGWIAGASWSWVNGSAYAHPLLLRYQQGQWQPVTLSGAADAYELNAVTMYSATEGWAVGTANVSSNQRSAYILHFQNGVWHRVGIGLPGLLYDVAEVTPGNVWAVGSVTPDSGSAVLHYQAGDWQRVTVPTPNILHSIAFSSVSDGWIGGDGEVLLHYDGSSWSNVGTVRHGFEIEHVSVVDPDDAWATGSYLTGDSQTDRTVTLLRYSSGIWRVYPLIKVIAVP